MSDQAGSSTADEMPAGKKHWFHINSIRLGILTHMIVEADFARVCFGVSGLGAANHELCSHHKEVMPQHVDQEYAH